MFLEEPAWGFGHILGWDSMTEADTNKQRERKGVEKGEEKRGGRG